MSLSTLPIHDGQLAEIDLVQLGSKSGFLWRSPNVTLAGLGAFSEVSLGVTSGADELANALADRRGVDEVGVPGSGPIAFAALPFDRNLVGSAQLPEIIIGQAGEKRFVTAPDSYGVDDVAGQVAALGSANPEAMPGTIRVERQTRATTWRDDIVARARDHLQNSDMQKAVFARELVLHADGDFPVGRIVRDLGRRFPEALLFAVDGFIGASPELLVSRSERLVRANPLAGTASRSDDPKVDSERIEQLRASKKDRTEHRITIDWLLAELLPFCSYVDAEPEPSVLSMSNVHHLGTLVEGVLSAPPASVIDLVAAVHPTPAVGGDPQGDALALVDKLEGFDRGRYGGPTGWVDANGNGEFAVSVRSAAVDGSTATVCAGVGVVAQSDPESELLETQAKFRAMLGSLLNPS